MANLSPDAHVLHALANQSLPWWKALAELVDNAFDASATQVVIEAKRRTLTVSDDGHGVQDILSIARLGRHDKQVGTKLGVYGIGAKDAWLSCADEMQIETIRGGMRSRLSVSVADLIKNNWECSDPTVEETDQPTRTRISFPVRTGKSMPSKEAYEELSFVFTPALRSGLQILKDTGKRELLHPHSMPELLDSVRSEFEVEGKQVSIDIGILPDGVNLERGPFWLTYKHRIIDRTSMGAGQYSVMRVAGTIVLGDGWALSKNKDDLTQHKERLEDAIFVRIEPLLKAASVLSESIESSALRHEVESSLNASMKHANAHKKREKRGSGESTGSVQTKNTGRVRAKATKVTDALGSVVIGPTVGRRGGFSLDWCELDNDSIGKFDRNGSRVSLNLNHQFIASAKAVANKMALLTCAASLIADDACRHDTSGNQLLKFGYADFASAIGGIVADFREGKANDCAAN